MSPKDLEEFEFKVNVETNIFSKVVEWMGEHIGKFIYFFFQKHLFF